MQKKDFVCRIMSNFSERLSELMFDKDLNATALSQEVGISQSTICSYLRGETVPYYEYIIKLADFFNCSSDFLLGLENENYAQNFKKCPPFGERIRAVLKECGKSQYRVEKDCKIAHSSFDYWKCGKTTPSASNLIKIASYLGITVDYVIGRTN